MKVAAPNPTYSTLDTPENTEGKDSREYNHAQKNGSKMEVVAANPSYSQTPFYSTLENTEGKDSTLNSDKEKKSTFVSYTCKLKVAITANYFYYCITGNQTNVIIIIIH